MYMHAAMLSGQTSILNTVAHNPRQELERYLDTPVEDVVDIVAWLGMHSRQYLTLTRIAKDFLAIQGSSIPSKHAFSSGGITGTAHRNSLHPTTFAALQILKAGYRNGHLSATGEAPLA
jgi:hypothetical protein